MKRTSFPLRLVQLLASMVPVAVFFVLLAYTVGPVMAGASDLVGWFANQIGGAQ